MSTKSEDLDFWDSTYLSPVNETKEKPCYSSTTKTEGEENRRDNFFDSTGALRPEVVGEWGGEEDTYSRNVPEIVSEKDDVFSDHWVSEEDNASRTLDSWDLPGGTVAWDDNDKPIERLLNYADLTLTPEEENGLLTDRIMAACSSYLTESPGTKCHILGKVCLDNKNLSDIRILGYHRFLQYIDLSWNNLTNITPLGCIPYLMYLDVSHNLIEEVLRFTPPMNLTYVNYSHNKVWQIDDLTDFWALSYLDLSHNKISKIQGLENLRYLRHLDLSHNEIKRLENLNHMNITDLNLEYNLISKFEMELGMGIKTLHSLRNLYLSNNLIHSLLFLEGAFYLRTLELRGNNISDLVELSHLKQVKNLRQLDLSGNPVSKQKPYRNLVLNFLQELRFLDETEVDISERVAACKKHRFDVQLEAAINKARMLLLEQLNDTSLNLDVTPVDQGPYPFVILVGPSASSKKHIVAHLGEKYPEKIYIGKLHTTKEVSEPEKKILVQMTREDFYESIKSGKFLCVTENLGQLYGFGREELAIAVKEHKLCLTAMDIFGALTIHSYGIQPTLILTILESRDHHTKCLKSYYGPIFSTIGAAFMSQKMNIDNHANIVLRIRSILEDIINGIGGGADEKKSACMHSEGSIDRTESEDNFHITYSNSSYVQVPKDAKNICFYAMKNCYPCTPTHCGYQTAHAATNDHKYLETNAHAAQSDSDNLYIPEVRLSASEFDIGTTSASSSYSATEIRPLKVEESSEEESICGEIDDFGSWSMPFIDWSEVNVDCLELEQAAELLCKKYIENVMSSRDVYQDLHLENPGLFSLCVYTDNFEEATKKVTNYLKEVWTSTPDRKPIYDLSEDAIYRAYIPRKLDALKDMLRKDFLSADGDTCFKAKRDVNRVNSPTTICANMRSKGYGDSVENL